MEFKISDLLNKYSGIQNPIEEKRLVKGIIKEKTNIEIEENKILFRKDQLILKINPVQKSLIFRLQNDILIEINNQNKNRILKRIIF